MDLTFKQSATPCQLVGGDELYAADVVMDGTFKKLLVKTDFEVSTDLQVFVSIVPIPCPVNQWTPLFTSTGIERTLSGLTLRTDKGGFSVRLIVDTVTIFEFAIDDLNNLIDWASAGQPSSYVSVNSNRRTFYFSPLFPLIAENSITLEVFASQNNSNIIGQVRQIS